MKRIKKTELKENLWNVDIKKPEEIKNKTQFKKYYMMNQMMIKK